MSYDLYFYRKTEDRKADGRPAKKGILGFLKRDNDDGTLLNDSELLAFLQSCGHFPAPELAADGFDAGYLNQETGTEAFFNLHRDTIPSVEREAAYPGFQYTGLSFTLNLIRPLYFGLEAMRIVAGMCKKFNLYVRNPQDGDMGGNGQPQPCTYAMLVSSWMVTDTQATRHQISECRRQGFGNVQFLIGPDLSAYLSSDKAWAWWEYTYSKDQIAAQIEDSGVAAFVPGLRVFRRKRDNTLLVGMALVEDVRYVFPPCDLFFVQRNGCKENGFAEAAGLLGKMKGSLAPARYGNIGLKILPAEAAKAFVGDIRGLALESPDDYEIVRPGRFIDVDDHSAE
jgi:hypothetical protein